MKTRQRLCYVTLCCTFACATGVEVSDEELAALLAESQRGIGGSITSSVGQGGAGGSVTSPVGQGGTGAGVTPLGGQSGTGGSSAPPIGGGGGTPSPITPGGGCGSPAPTASGGCSSDTGIAVLYSDRSDSPSFNQLTMALSVEGVGDVSLQDLVLRYWFAADEGQADFVAEIDYAQIGKENVCVSFGNQLGQAFADIGFSGGAASDGAVRDVQVRLHTPNYAPQDQSNDFSFAAGADGAANENITVYLSGARVSGCEP